MATFAAEAAEALSGVAGATTRLDGMASSMASTARDGESRAVAEAATGTREVSRHTGGLSQGATATGKAATQVA